MDTNSDAEFSNYGLSTVDLGAPGVGILSTTPNNRYENNKISIKKQKNENYKNNEDLRIKNREYQNQRYETNKQYYKNYYNTLRQDEDKKAKRIKANITSVLQDGYFQGDDYLYMEEG